MRRHLRVYASAAVVVVVLTQLACTLFLWTALTSTVHPTDRLEDVQELGFCKVPVGSIKIVADHL